MTWLEFMCACKKIILSEYTRKKVEPDGVVMAKTSRRWRGLANQPNPEFLLYQRRQQS